MARSRQPDITIRDRIYVRQGAIPTRHIKERYAFHLYDESKCENCPNLPDRHNDTCDACPAQAYHGHFRFYDRKETSDGVTYSLPVADIVHVRAYAKRNGLEIVNYAKDDLPPMARPLKFTGKLFDKGDIDKNGYERADQVTLVEQWLRKKRGIILAAPRTGKTVLAAYIACELGTRTLIVAHQYELLNQFYAAFVGNEEEGRPAMTSAAKYRDSKNKQVIIAKNFKQVVESKADVVICTAASLYNHIKGRAIFKKLKGKFGFMVVDEVHRLFADKFTQAVAQIPALYGLGLTATDQRLDDRDMIRNMIIGGVVAESKHVSLTPDIELLKSKSYAPSDYKTWTAAMKWVARDKVRNGEIVSEVFRRLRQGHKCVAVPVETKLHMRTLVEMINDRCEDEGFEPNLAVKLEAKSRDRKEILRKANHTDEPFVIVPISRIFKDGLDLASLSCVIRPVPSASEEGKGAPMFRQGAFRCATPAKNKKQPVVVLMLDELTMFRNQMRKLFFFELLPGSKKKLYRMPPKVREALAGIPRFITRDTRKGASRRHPSAKIDKSCLWATRA